MAEEDKNIHMKDFELEEDEEEFEISNYNGNQEDTDFDNVVGCLQDIVISEEFENLQQSFFKKHYKVFEDTEENKMEYMNIFKEYQKIIESYIEQGLRDMIENFEMRDFLELLPERQDQIEEQLMDLLFSFSDFSHFKALVLDYRKDFEEIERIEKLKTIKQTAKKTLNKANQQVKNTGNIFSDSNKHSNLFQKQNDPIQDLKNLKISDNIQKKQQQQQQQVPDIKEEDLQRSFFIDCRQLATPQIQKKK